MTGAEQIDAIRRAARDRDTAAVHDLAVDLVKESPDSAIHLIEELAWRWKARGRPRKYPTTGRPRKYPTTATVHFANPRGPVPLTYCGRRNTNAARTADPGGVSCEKCLQQIGWYGLDGKRIRPPAERLAAYPDRDAEIVRRLSEGETLQTVGDRFGISRERVRQIAKAAGLDVPTLRAAQKKGRAEKRQAERDAATITAVCKVCGKPFGTLDLKRVTCSRDCAVALSRGRRYIDADYYERQRVSSARYVASHPERYSAPRVNYALRVVAGDVSARGRWVIDGSKVTEALRRVGRDDLLPSPAPPAPPPAVYPCSMTSLRTGLPCKRTTSEPGGVCCVHAKERPGRR
jgi:hypothetical protein